MTRIGTVVLSLIGLSLTACQQPKMTMAEMMKMPPRAAELDQLSAFVGTWEGTSEGIAHMAGGEKVTGSGTETYVWECDKRVLLNRMQWKMGDCTMHGIGIWRWNAGAKKFDTFWTSDFGDVGHGQAWYDAETKTWHMRGKGDMGGHTSVGEGTMKMVDNNTMEWSWVEWNSWKTEKTMEMKGTSKRKS